MCPENTDAPAKEMPEGPTGATDDAQRDGWTDGRNTFKNGDGHKKHKVAFHTHILTLIMLSNNFH